MPDGFTPVSLSLFDNQVSLIVTQYSLKGVNVLVHCRGECLTFCDERLVDHALLSFPTCSHITYCSHVIPTFRRCRTCGSHCFSVGNQDGLCPSSSKPCPCGRSGSPTSPSNDQSTRLGIIGRATHRVGTSDCHVDRRTCHRHDSSSTRIKGHREF